MVTTAPAAGTLTAAEPVPVAVVARTSTLALQNPVASVRRQLRACTEWLPAGWFIAAVYSDVESGATDIDARSQGDAHRVLTDAGLPRDGGMADLLTEAASPSPRFAVVVCEDIERSARDTFNALRAGKGTVPRTGYRCSPPTSPQTSPASTPPPSWSAGSSKGSPSGTGCS